MITNYLLIASRNMWKDKQYSLINIAGLAVGLAACILILLFVRDELSFDSEYADASRVYRVEMTITPPGRTPQTWIVSSGRSRDGFVNQFTEVDTGTRLYITGTTITRDATRFNERVTYVDPEFFDIFDLAMAEGDRSAIFSDNHSLIITETTARKYFGDESPIGQTLTIDDQDDFQVVGVFKDLPRNTHLDMDFIGWFDTDRYSDDPRIAESWTWLNVYTYLKFRAGADVEAVRSELPAFIDRNVVLDFQGMEKYQPSTIMHYRLVGLLDLHLRSESDQDFKPSGNIATVYSSAAIALLVLIIAAINFMNLSTAKSSQRAREVGMRKVLGARRRDLVLQFLGEAILTAVLALLVAGAIVEIILPWYNLVIDKELVIDLSKDAAFLSSVVALGIFIGLLSGIYPAFYLSSFRPARVLSASERSSGGGGSALRSTLVLVQFSISIALIAATAVIFAQTEFARTADLGYNKDNMLVIAGTGQPQTAQSAETLKQEIQKIPGVISVTQTAYIPTSAQQDNFPATLPDATDPVIVTTLSVDFDFFETYGIKALAGRLLLEDRGTDRLSIPADPSEPVTVNVLLNETAVSRLGFGRPEEAIGRTFGMLVSPQRSSQATVIGVVPDMHFQSFRSPVRPKVFLSRADRFNNLTVHFGTDDLPALLDAVDGKWRALFPAIPIQRGFLDQAIEAQYGGERRAASLITAFSVLAILVACLGLFGLAANAADRRTKEIGIRKILGARVHDIVKLLVWQFSRPVLLANLVAWPIAYYAMGKWLEGFAYRIELTPLFFIGAGLLAIVIAWATVGLHATRVARSNPVDALRHE